MPVTGADFTAPAEECASSQQSNTRALIRRLITSEQ